MKRLILLLLVSISICAECQMTQHLIGPLPAYNGQHANTKIPYLKYTPASVASNPNKKYPVIVSFHGIGERTELYSTMASVSTGDLPDLLVSGTGLPYFYATSTSALVGDTWRPYNDATQPAYEFIVYAPQCWQGYSYFYPIYGDAMLDEIEKNPNADLDRVYFVGLSFGGGAVLTMLQDPNISDRVAAAFSSCAGYSRYIWDSPQHSDYGNTSTGFAGWNGLLIIQHSINDSTTDPAVMCCPRGKGSWHSDRAVDSINNRYKGKTTVEYYQYTTGGHVIWDRAFNPANASVNYSLNNGQTMNWSMPLFSRLLTRTRTKNRRL